jgi:mycoredoxin
VTIRVLGTTWCGDCTRARAFFDAHQVSYQWTDIEIDDGAAAEVEAHNGGHRIVPTIYFDGGAILVEPSNEELAAQLGI